MKVPPMSGRVVHFEIPADDIGRAGEFYRSAFGWDISPVPGSDYAMAGATPLNAEGVPLEPGSINGGLMLREGQMKNPIVTIDVDDIDQALDKIGELGGTTVLPKEEVMGMGYTAYFTDSEGNLMGLWQSGI